MILFGLLVLAVFLALFALALVSAAAVEDRRLSPLRDPTIGRDMVTRAERRR